MKTKSSKLLLPLLIPPLLGIGAKSYASGFELNEKSVASSAMANAGDVVNAETSAALFFNPAAITQLSGTHVSGGLSYIDVTPTFSGSATNYLGEPMQGSNGGDFVDPVLAPNLSLTHQVGDVVTLGFGLSAPFGARSDYDDDFVGRNFALLTDLRVIDAQSSIGLKGDQGLSLGASVHVMRADGELTRRQDLSNYGLADGTLKAKGDDVQLAYTLGLYYEPNDRVQLGMVFNTGTKFELEGDTTATGLPSPRGGTVTLIEPSKLPLYTPDSLSFGIGYKVTPEFELFASAKWSKWSEFESLDLISTADNAGDAGTISAIGTAKYGGENTITHVSANWKDTWSYAVGARWQFVPAFALKAGYAFDESPANPDYLSARVPSTDRQWFTLGLQWLAPRQFTVDVAAGYLLMDDPSIDQVERDVNDQPLNNQGRLTGSYDIDAWGAGIQLSKAF